MKKNELFYERYAMGDFSKFQMEKLRKTLTPSDLNIIHKIQIRNKITLRKYPIKQFLEDHKRRMASKRAIQLSSSKRWFLSFFRTAQPNSDSSGIFSDNAFSFFRISVPVVAIVCIVLLGFFFTSVHKDTTFRLKGNNEGILRIFRETQDSFEEIYPLDKVDEGDRLQLAFNSHGYRYGAVFSIDGNKNITFHFPLSLEGSILLPVGKNGKDVLLNSGYTLDNAPEFECFFFIYAPCRFSLKEIVAEIISVDNSDLKNYKKIGQIEIKTFLLIKGDPG